MKPSTKLSTKRLQPLAAAALALCAAAPAAHAAAVTDGSVGAVQSLSGAMTIPQALGTVRGTNLFHSFARFGIAPGESATFTTTDAALRHVIARVTGGEASTLQGPLALRAAGSSTPDLWLVNPAGLLVGAGASFDVPAGLHLGTAPQLRFADGTVWATGSAAPSTLSIAAPESFGFIGGQAAAALQWQDTNVALNPGGTLELAAGDLALERSLLVANDARLRVQASSMTLTGATGLSTGLLLQTSGAGESAALELRANQALTMGPDTLIRSINFGAAPAGALHIETGTLTMTGGAALGSFAFGPGPAADLRVGAAAVRLEGAGSGLLTRGLDGAAGGIHVVASGALEVTGGAGILSVSSGFAPPGEVFVYADTATLRGVGTSLGSLALGGTAAGAAVRLTGASRVTVNEGAEVASDTFSAGRGGTVHVTAPLVEVGGDAATVSRIGTSSVDAVSGDAGTVTVVAGRLLAGVGTQISSLTVSDVGHAADVTVRADTAVVDGGGIGALIQSFAGSAFGNAGAVRVDVRDTLTLREGGFVSAGTLGFGGSGSIAVSAGSLLIDGRRAVNLLTGMGAGAQGAAASAPISVDAGRIEMRDGAVITTLTASSAPAGTIRIRADALLMDGSNLPIPTAISSDSAAGGPAGRIEIQAREVRVANRSFISSTALAGGPGGTVAIDAQRLVVDAGAISTDTFSTGDSGSIDIRGGDVHVTNLGRISASTNGSGRGGSVAIAAQSLTVDAASGIFSLALAAGDAGRIDLAIAGALRLTGGGKVTANTDGPGAGGQVNVRAGTLSIVGRDVEGFPSGIAARALPGSGGRPGNVSIDVAGAFELRDGGIVNIANEARVADPTLIAPSALSVRAGELMVSDAAIVAASTENVDAGRITISTAGGITLQRAAITTSAVDGDGGPVTLTSGGTLLVKDSGITTSVTGGTNGNGGDITISGAALALASGFVQANTAAPLALGGNVVVNVGLLVPDGSNVFVGGSRITAFRSGVPGFNVVQAAAPDGVAGQLDLTRPELNLSGSLVALLVPVIDFGLIGRDICAATDTESSFSVLGRGALPAPAAAPLRLDPRVGR